MKRTTYGKIPIHGTFFVDDRPYVKLPSIRWALDQDGRQFRFADHDYVYVMVPQVLIPSVPPC